MTTFFCNSLARRGYALLKSPGGIRSLRENSKLEGGTHHKVNALEKRFLVWTGKYKTLAEVPAYVSQNVVERARNRMRIKIANYMMLVTALACAAMVYLGKQDAAKGETITKQNIEWHKQYAADQKKQEETKASSK